VADTSVMEVTCMDYEAVNIKKINVT